MISKELEIKIKSHPWDAPPDDVRAMNERVEIWNGIKQLKFDELAAVLKNLSPEVASKLLTLRERMTGRHDTN